MRAIEEFRGIPISVISWATAAASKHTFRIKPIRALVERYIGDGIGWIDPYCGESRLCQFRNDLRHAVDAPNHMDALDFCLAAIEEGYGPFRGVAYDPPFSYRQVSEHYREEGIRPTRYDTSNQYYNRVKNAVCDHVSIGGYAISCGWNSNGFGLNRGFVPVELLVVRHGQHHNDTIVLVEEKSGRGP